MNQRDRTRMANLFTISPLLRGAPGVFDVQYKPELSPRDRPIMTESEWTDEMESQGYELYRLDTYFEDPGRKNKKVEDIRPDIDGYFDIAYAAVKGKKCEYYCFINDQDLAQEHYEQHDLRNPEYVGPYLSDCIKEDFEIFWKALEYVVRVNGWVEISKQAGLTRDTVYKLFTGHQNPTVGSLRKILHALGLEIAVVPKTPYVHKKLYA